MNLSGCSKDSFKGVGVFSRTPSPTPHSKVGPTILKVGPIYLKVGPPKYSKIQT